MAAVVWISCVITMTRRTPLNRANKSEERHPPVNKWECQVYSRQSPKKWNSFISNLENKTKLKIVVGSTWLGIARKVLPAGYFGNWKEVASVAWNEEHPFYHMPEKLHNEATHIRMFLHATWLHSNSVTWYWCSFPLNLYISSFKMRPAMVPHWGKGHVPLSPNTIIVE